MAVAPRYRQYALSRHSEGLEGLRHVLFRLSWDREGDRRGRTRVQSCWDRRDPLMDSLWRGERSGEGMPAEGMDRDSCPSAGLSSQRRREKGHQIRRGDNILAQKQYSAGLRPREEDSELKGLKRLPHAVELSCNYGTCLIEYHITFFFMSQIAAAHPAAELQGIR